MDLPCASTLPDVSQLCAERVPSVCQACCAERVTAPARGRPGVRSGRRTRHTTRTATNPAQTDTQTQTRRAKTRRRAAHRRRRIPVRSRPHADRHADAQSRDMHSRDTRAAPPRPWRRTCRGTARPRLLDLQLPRRRQTSCPALLALVALCCLRGNRTEGTEFMTEFMDPVRVS